MEKKEICRQLKALIVDLGRLPYEPDHLADDEPLLNGPRVQLDSMAILNLLVEVESRFGCDLGSTPLSGALDSLDGLCLVVETSLIEAEATGCLAQQQ